MEESGERDTGIGRWFSGPYSREHRRRVVRWLRQDDKLTKLLLPVSGLFAAFAAPASAAGLGITMPSFIPSVFHFSTKDVVADIKFWMQQSLEGWYHFVGTIFESMINLILYTPKILIHNPQVQMLWGVFITVTIGALSVMCLVEGIKMVLGHSRTNFLQFLGRTVIAFAGISVILPAMTIGLDFVNKFVQFFTNLAFGEVEASEFVGRTLSDTFANGTLGLLGSLVFIILFLYYMFRILLYYGRRWFDIIMSAIISPLALGSTIFDSTTHYFQKWWSHTLQLYMVQIIHAVYVTVIALVVLLPSTIVGVGTGMIKVLILIGALWRMSTPPKFVSSMTGSPDSRDMIRDIVRKVVKVKSFKFRGGK